MEFIAKYKGNSNYNIAAFAALEMLKNDRYYCRYNRDFGTKIVFDATRDSGYINPTVKVNGEPVHVFDLVVDHIIHLDEVSWTSSKNNITKLLFDHEKQEVTVVIDSRRHGIPWAHLLKALSAPAEVLTYETREPNWKPFETADDH